MLLVAAIVATTVLAVAVFTGSSGGSPATPVPAQHDTCVPAGPQRMVC
jgi:hypothetical protein